MTAGHIGMLAIFGLPYLIGIQPGALYENSPPQPSWIFALVAVILNIGIFFLEMIVSLVQAYVFTLLSSVFIGMAIHAEH
jgi:F-type H+-transporting ATPase subunit a